MAAAIDRRESTILELATSLLVENPWELVERCCQDANIPEGGEAGHRRAKMETRTEIDFDELL